MLGAQVGDQLADLLVRQRIGKRRHFLPTVEDLVRDFGRWPELVGADLGERRAFFATHAADPMTEGATFITEQNRACRLVGLRICSERGTEKNS